MWELHRSLAKRLRLARQPLLWAAACGMLVSFAGSSCAVADDAAAALNPTPIDAGASLHRKANSKPVDPGDDSASISKSPSGNSASATTPKQSPAKAKLKEKTNPSVAADALVKEALYHEIYGDTDKREQLLSEARATVPNFAPAMWASGEVTFNKHWVNVDDVPDLAKKSTDLGAYEQQRDKAADNLGGELNLARWCLKRGLNEQARAHYNMVLAFDSNNVEARNQLGFVRAGNSWIQKADYDNMVTEAQRVSEAMSKWETKVANIRNGLLRGPGKAFDAAKQQWDDIKDPEAIPALEYSMAAVTEDLAKMLVDKLGTWPTIPATQALMREAVYSPWVDVRTAASKQLKDRPKETYVPALLNAMYRPMEARSVIVNVDGRMVSREVYAREGRNNWEIAMIDNVYDRVPIVRNIDQNTNIGRTATHPIYYEESDFKAEVDAFKTAQRASAVRLYAAAMQNARTEELSKRIMGTLATATDQTALVRPDDWWTWWDTQNETLYSSEKPYATYYSRSDWDLTDQNYSGSLDTQPSIHEMHSCFAAGTPVWTLAGLKPIEKLRIGDVVLSQNTESGELTFKPVLRTTVRQNAEVFTVETSGPKFQCTGGHLFWVAGEGWTKARDLHAGQSLHCASGTVQVSQVSASPPQNTYNLVVADFNTYFIGKERILAHDVTEKTPTRSIVPGLPKEIASLAAAGSAKP